MFLVYNELFEDSFYREDKLKVHGVFYIASFCCKLYFVVCVKYVPFEGEGRRNECRIGGNCKLRTASEC